MRTYAPFRGAWLGSWLGSLLALGCAAPQTQGAPTGGGNSTGSAGSSGGGNSSGAAGTTGAGNTTGSAGTSGSACVAMPTQLVNSAAWNCDLSDPIGIQGAIYGYGDGSSCANPQPADICSTGSCCISGTTVVDATSAKWGCGIGMELDSSGGASPVKSQYTGPVKCFNITLTGSSGGNVVRIGFTQSANSTTVAPFSEIAAFASGWTGQVCFTDAECPSWATAAQCSKPVGTVGTPYDMQIQVSAGATATSVGTYNVCVSSIVPVTSTTGAGGTGGGTSSCTSVTGAGTISAQYGTAHVSCSGKDYIVQNNDWGVSTASQTITYGTGTKFKVATQNGTGANNNPASFPSIFTGANSNNSTAGSGLPRAVSSIAKGSLSTSWTWTANGATGSYNAAYDVWFSTGSGGDPAASSPSGGFLMVWYEKPTANQPIGASVASTTIDGKNWNVWYGTNSGNGKPCVSYVAQQTINSLTYSLGDFIQDAVTRGYLQNSWYLTNVFAGYEIWNGGVGLETTDFSVTVPLSAGGATDGDVPSIRSPGLPRPPRPASRRPLSAADVFVAFFCLYLLTASGSPPFGDALPMWRAAESLVRHGSLAIDLRWPVNAPLGRGGHYYPVAALLACLVHVPGALLQRALEALAPARAGQLLVATSQLAPILLGALTPALFFRLLGRLGYNRRQAAWTTLLLGTGTALWVYARCPYSEILQAACFVAFLGALLRTGETPTRGTFFRWGLTVALLVNAKNVYFACLPGALLYLFLQLRTRRRELRAGLVWAGLGLAPGLVALGAYNAVRWGSPFTSGYEAVTVGFWRENILVGLWGQFLSPGKSVFLFSPPLLLGLWGIRRLVARRPHVALAISLTVGPIVLVCAHYLFWSGDWAWGPRFLVFALPALLLPAAELFERDRPRGRTLWAGVGALLLAGVAVQGLGNAFVWNDFINVARQAQITWLGRPDTRGNVLYPAPCPSCFEEVYGLEWLPPLQPIAGHWWLLRHKLAGDDWRVATADAPWTRHTSLGLDIERPYRAATINWWPLVAANRRPWPIAILSLLVLAIATPLRRWSVALGRSADGERGVEPPPSRPIPPRA